MIMRITAAVNAKDNTELECLVDDPVLAVRGTAEVKSQTDAQKDYSMAGHRDTVSLDKRPARQTVRPDRGVHSGMDVPYVGARRAQRHHDRANREAS